jgi:5'(3')-deoxyribonucleotidase
MRPILCVDMDEVIADALGEHLLRYSRDFGVNITAEELRGHWLWEHIPPAHVDTVAQYMLTEDFFSVLQVLPHSQRVL